MRTKVEIRKIMFDYEKMCEMIVSEFDFAVTDDNIPEERWEEHIKYLIERGLHEYFEMSIEIHHLNNVIFYMSRSTDTINISGDGTEIYNKPKYYAQEQALGENLPDGEEVYLDNRRQTVRELSTWTVLRKIRLGIRENIENEYHNSKKLEKIMMVFLKVCGDEDFHAMLKNNLGKILKNNK